MMLDLKYSFLSILALYFFIPFALGGGCFIPDDSLVPFFGPVKYKPIDGCMECYHRTGWSSQWLFYKVDPKRCPGPYSYTDCEFLCTKLFYPGHPGYNPLEDIPKKCICTSDGEKNLREQLKLPQNAPLLISSVVSLKLPNIPNSCFKPNGTDCSWYRNCLQKVYNCSENEKEEYAISYGEKFCELYEKNFEKFSPEAQVWINDVRKCLQVTLADKIFNYNINVLTDTKITCDEIQYEAFSSHAPCYKRPNPDSNKGICDLKFKDWWQVFLTIKGAFKDQFYESIKGMFEVGEYCFFRPFSLNLDYNPEEIQMYSLSMERSIPRDNTQLPYVIEKIFWDESIEKLSMSIEEKLDLNKDKVDVQIYLISSLISSGKLISQYRVILTNLEKSNGFSQVNRNFQRLVSSGELRIPLSNGQTLSVNSTSICSDLACKAITLINETFSERTTTPKMQISSGANKKNKMIGNQIIFLYFILEFLNKIY